MRIHYLQHVPFHLETTRESAKLLVENCREELDGSQYVQSEKDIIESLGVPNTKVGT